MGNLKYRRITDILLKHWETLKGSKALPFERDIDSEVLKEVWDCCFLLQVRDMIEHDSYNYTFLGDAIREAYTGRMLQEDDASPLIQPVASKLHRHFQQVVETKEPLIHQGNFTNAEGNLVKYRQCLLPFAHEGESVDAILGGMRFRVFKPE